MTIDVGSSKPSAIDFTDDGVALFVRKMPLRLGLKMQGAMNDDGNELPAEVVADIIHQCVVLKDGSAAFQSTDAVLDMDAGVMLELFAKVSGLTFTAEDAEKN